MPGMNGSNAAGVPSVSDSVAGTEPPAVPSVLVATTGSWTSPETATLLATPLPTWKSQVTCGTRTSSLPAASVLPNARTPSPQLPVTFAFATGAPAVLVAVMKTPFSAFQ